MGEETTDEIVVRFSNVGHRQKLDKKKLLGVGREHCVRDYSCCGHVPQRCRTNTFCAGSVQKAGAVVFSKKY